MANSRSSLSKKSAATYVLMIVSFILSGYAIIEIVSEPSGGRDWYLPIVYCSTVWVIFYLFASWRVFRHIYLFSTAYLTALIMFHLGLFYQRALGSIKFPSSWEQGAFSPWMENAGWHIILALSAFGIGFSCAVSTGKKYLKVIDPEIIGQTKKIGLWSATGLLIAATILFVFALQSYGNLLNYARDEIFSSHADSRGFGVFMMIFPGSVLLYYFSAITRKQKFFGLLLAVFAFLLFMFAGYRSASLFPSLVGVVLWIKSGRKIPLPIVGGGVFLVLVLIAASGYLRTMGKFSELNTDDVSKAFEKSSIESSISEIGASVKALASVLQLVPSKDGYRYGASYFSSFIDSVPNVGFKTNVEASREYVLKNKAKDPSLIRRMRPADWLTYRIAPWHFRQGFGVGFSAIAEPYLNFGSVGVFFIFIGLGFGIGKMDCIPLFYSPRFFIFSASMFWFLVTTVRNDSSNLFKPLIFTIIILFIWWGGSKVFFQKKVRWQV